MDDELGDLYRGIENHLNRGGDISSLDFVDHRLEIDDLNRRTTEIAKLGMDWREWNSLKELLAEFQQPGILDNVLKSMLLVIEVLESLEEMKKKPEPVAIGEQGTHDLIRTRTTLRVNWPKKKRNQK